MSRYYTDVAGAPPACYRKTWRAWYVRLLEQRAAACPLDRTTTYYFDSGGNDANSGLTSAAPKKSITAMNTLIAASSGDLRIRIKAGSIWRGTTGIVIDKDNVTIDTYGAGKKPLLSRFSVAYTAGFWAATAGQTKTYEQTQAAAIGWVRERDDLDYPYIRQTSVANVEANAGSWYWDGSKVYIHPRGSTDPTSDGRAYEAVLRNADSGIGVSGTGCRVQGIRCDGWGLDDSNSSNQGYGVRFTGNGEKEFLCIDCEAYYASSHAIGHYASGLGGISTWITCTAGYTLYNGSPGETIFNCFSTGQLEAIWDGCHAKYGTLPDSRWGASGGRAGAMYAHGVNDGPALYISRGLRITNTGTTYCSGGALCNSSYIPSFDPQGAADIQKCRVFVVDEEWWTGTARHDFYPGHCFVNCRFYTHVTWGPQGLSQGGIGAALFNCIFRMDSSIATYGGFYFTTQPNTGLYHSCSFIVNCLTNAPGTTRFTSHATKTAALVNCLVMAHPLGVFGVELTSDADHMAGNAFLLCSGTYTTDTRRVDLSTLLDVTALAGPGSPLYRAGVPAPLGIALEFDANNNHRNVRSPTIGALAHDPLSEGIRWIGQGIG